MTPTLQEPDAAKAVAAHPDQELLDLSNGLAAAWDESRRPGNTTEQTEAGHDQVFKISERIAHAPAQTVAGLAVKLRVVQHFADDRLVLPKPGDDRSQHDVGEWAIAKALWDAERLAGKAPP
ncbi:MAG: hypothetical protein ACE5EU_14295, partial [Paracoccaceae bacterium]